MGDNLLPQSIGTEGTEFIHSSELNEICRRLDSFYETSGVQLDILPSSIFRGAIFAMTNTNIKNNPDWMAQVAHSLREILYQFDNREEIEALHLNNLVLLITKISGCMTLEDITILSLILLTIILKKPAKILLSEEVKQRQLLLAWNVLKMLLFNLEILSLQFCVNN